MPVHARYFDRRFDADFPDGRRHLQPFAKYSVTAAGSGAIPGVAFWFPAGVFDPTTIGAIGGLLSAIGIAGMDCVMRHNVLAMSRKARLASWTARSRSSMLVFRARSPIFRLPNRFVQSPRASGRASFCGIAGALTGSADLQRSREH